MHIYICMKLSHISWIHIYSVCVWVGITIFINMYIYMCVYICMYPYMCIHIYIYLNHICI